LSPVHRRPILVAACAMLATLDTVASAQRAERSRAPESILGGWRIVRGVVAPWVRQAKSVASNRQWIGQTVAFAPRRVMGPGALRCDRATYTPTSMPADLLFQGSLSAPAADAAAALGLVAMPVRGVSLACDTGVFELHRADATTLLLALDNVIYTLDRSPGAFAADTSPAGVVQRLLEQHFATSMAFDSAHIRYHAPWLGARLRGRIARYLARPVDPNEAPAIDGDPFTDTQEHPTRFSVRLATVSGDAATVPVHFTDGRRTRVVRYVLRRERGAWRVDDLRYDRGETLSAWLR
jgi:hypothetical protein